MSASIGKMPDNGYTILVSEDDPSVRRSIQLLLRSRGYGVRGYTSGSALLADPRSTCADCLIVDCRMPDIDGMALLRKLRETGWHGSAIMISAYHNRQLERARQAGFEDVIAKPIIGRTVLDAVARHAHGRSVQ